MKNKRGIIIISLCVLAVLVILMCWFLLTREKTVEDITKDFFKQYTSLDEEIVKEIEYDFDDALTEQQKSRYVSIMEKQYSDLKYTIVNVREEGPLAFVEVEIEVYDLQAVMEKADSYVEIYNDKFYEDNELNMEKVVNYKLDALEKAEERVTYSITFSFSKENDEYVMNDLTDSDLNKIKGIY